MSRLRKKTIKEEMGIKYWNKMGNLNEKEIQEIKENITQKIKNYDDETMYKKIKNSLEEYEDREINSFFYQTIYFEFLRNLYEKNQDLKTFYIESIIETIIEWNKLKSKKKCI